MAMLLYGTGTRKDRTTYVVNKTALVSEFSQTYATSKHANITEQELSDFA